MKPTRSSLKKAASARRAGAQNDQCEDSRPGNSTDAQSGGPAFTGPSRRGGSQAVVPRGTMLSSGRGNNQQRQRVKVPSGNRLINRRHSATLGTYRSSARRARRAHRARRARRARRAFTAGRARRAPPSFSIPGNLSSRTPSFSIPGTLSSRTLSFSIPDALSPRTRSFSILGTPSSATMLGSSESPTMDAQATGSSRDLADWLEMTGWDNVEFRVAELARFREFREMSRQRDLDDFRGVPAGSTMAPRDSRERGDHTFGPHSAPMPAPGMFRRTPYNAGHHGTHVPHDSHGSSGYAAPRRIYAHHSGMHEGYGHAYSTSHESTFQNEGPRGRDRSWYTSRAARSSSPNDAGRGIGPERDYRDYRDVRPRPEPTDDERDMNREYQNYGQPNRVELGNPGETRFFIVKSFNFANVYACQDDGVWATSAANADLFTRAFAECKNVILFFSTNRSRLFNGYARMESAPSSAIEKPGWYHEFRGAISEPFEVQWISKMAVEDRYLRHISNALNAGLSITRSRDGQEVDGASGREMLEIMNREALIALRAGDRG
ncbi:YT521-B-like domain-containing protein [Xylariomycetidae sp. FL0641]|nr:YT521-B-like domain-containing protein [Xylariomycetidae sp. FL0641]